MRGSRGTAKNTYVQFAAAKKEEEKLAKNSKDQTIRSTKAKQKR